MNVTKVAIQWTDEPESPDAQGLQWRIPCAPKHLPRIGEKINLVAPDGRWRYLEVWDVRHQVYPELPEKDEYVEVLVVCKRRGSEIRGR